MCVRYGQGCGLSGASAVRAGLRTWFESWTGANIISDATLTSPVYVLCVIVCVYVFGKRLDFIHTLPVCNVYGGKYRFIDELGCFRSEVSSVLIRDFYVWRNLFFSVWLIFEKFRVEFQCGKNISN